MTPNHNRSNFVALAPMKCTHCRGTGLRLTRRPDADPTCKCVKRAIFRACHDRFRQIQMQERLSNPTKTGPLTWSRIREEYCADFLAIAKRTLTEEEHQVFRFHYLLGADWKMCTRRLKVDKGTFFHACYRIQEKLGTAYSNMQPYSLYPLDEYFSGSMRNAPVKPTPTDPAAANILRPPVVTEAYPEAA